MPSRQEDRQHPAMAAPPPMRFRLVADFVVDGSPLPALYKNGDLNEPEKSLIHVIMSNPEAFNRTCRLVLPCDLHTHEGLFEGKFSGPDWKDVFAAILPYLSPEDQAYWLRLRRNAVDDVDSLMEFIFNELESSLERFSLQDASTGEEIPCQVSSRLGQRKA